MANNEFSLGADQFALDLSKTAAMFKEDGNKFCRAIAANAFEQIIRYTPVGNPSGWKNPKAAPPGYVGGTARNSWFFTLGKPSNAQASATPEASGSTALGSLSGIAAGKMGDTFYLNNNVPYIRRLEFGWSKQAPSGMVRKAFENIRAFYQNDKNIQAITRKYGK